MGRRNRRRIVVRETQRAAIPVPDRQARVRVSDDVWRDFQLAVQPRSIAVVLGELVVREVDRFRAARVNQGTADDWDLLEALRRAHELHDELIAVIERLERRT